MNQLIAAVSTIALTLVLMAFGKRPSMLIKSLNKSSAADEGSNYDQLSLVQNKDIGNKRKFRFNLKSENSLDIPKSYQERIAFHRKIVRAMKSGPDERLNAVKISGLWGHSSVLPVLLRGLKDSDSRVVKASALAIQRFKGLTNKHLKNQELKVRPPRNVSRMR